MYRFTPSSQPVSNPLQGLIGLGAVSSYYRTPIYSCTKDSNVVEYAKSRCASRKSTTQVNYKKGYSSILKGTPTNPYQITYSDVYSGVFDACRVKVIKPCSTPKPSQPIIVTDPSELVHLPAPTYHAAPVKPGPIVVDSSDDLIHLPPPTYHAAPVRDESTPVLISSLPPPKDPLNAQMLQEVTRSSKAGVVLEPPTIEVVEEDESDSSKYLIGGILLLAVGGGAAYYFLRKKRK